MRVISNIVGVAVVGALLFAMRKHGEVLMRQSRVVVYGRTFSVATLYDLIATVVSFVCALILARGSASVVQ